MLLRSTSLSALFLLVAVSACAAPEAEVSFTTYGEPLTLSETTSVSAILAEPDAFVGQHLRIEGTIVGVCENRGCWMAIAGENDGEQLRIAHRRMLRTTL